MENILYLLYFAAHTVAAILSLMLEYSLVGTVEELGPAAWALAILWVALLVLDILGRLSLHGVVWRVLAAALFPALCGGVDIMIRGRADDPPAVWAYFLTLLLLSAYVLLGQRANGPVLRERGHEVGIFILLWLMLLGGGVLLMATLGCLFSLIIGGLIASKNTLLDYEGLAGVLIGLVLLEMIRLSLFWRASHKMEEQKEELL